jgi:N-acylneuraminate cytidylyltransferase
VSDGSRLLAVITARGGSKGLPGKNIRPFAGLPLIAHSILFTRMCPEIDRCIVSTDDPEIAKVARQYDADVPFQRPAELATDEIAMLPVLQHALAFVEEEEGRQYDSLLLVDPTSPGRWPEDLTGALKHLADFPTADGVIGVSQPEFNPYWHCVLERDGWMVNLIDGAEQFARRQDVPPVFRINGLLYLWRTSYVRTQTQSWQHTDKHIVYEIPENRSISFDDIDQFNRGDLMVNHGLIHLPWLDQAPK